MARKRGRAMVVGLVISIIGSLLILIGSLGLSWVDEEVVQFADSSLYQGYQWWSGIIVLITGILAGIVSGIGLSTHRKKLFAIAGLVISVITLIFLILTPFVIRNEIIEWIKAGLMVKETKIAMWYGYHLAFLGVLLNIIGYVWTLGAQPILSPEDRLLRVAILWGGRLVTEKTFTEKRDITIGDGVRSDFVVPHSGIGKMFPLFKVDRSGNYSVALLRDMKGRVNIGGVLAPVSDYVRKYTGDTMSGANYVQLEKGDWGILEFGPTEVFFQFVKPSVVIGHKKALGMDGTIVAAIIGCFFVVMSFFIFAQFLWNPASHIETRKVEKRELKVDMNIVEEKEEKLLEIGEEDDTTGKKAEGEEGKFGDPDKDPSLESKVPKRDGQMVSKIDPKKIGLANVLSQMQKSGALSSIMSDNVDSFDNRMAVAMAGTGSELVVGFGAGGMGFKGSGPGGGGTGGYGRIHGLGRVDTGGGMGMRAGLGQKAAKTVGKISLGGMSGTGFCQRNNIMSVVMQRAGAIRACYEAQLQIHEGLTGKVTVRWTINLEGSVENAVITQTTLGNSAVEECVLRTIRHMRFAKPEGGICVVQWPFVFSPG